VKAAPRRQRLLCPNGDTDYIQRGEGAAGTSADEGVAATSKMPSRNTSLALPGCAHNSLTPPVSEVHGMARIESEQVARGMVLKKCNPPETT